MNNDKSDAFGQTSSGRTMITDIDFSRLEKKVDKVAEALNKLVLVEERQTNQGQRIGELEKELAILSTRVAAVDRKVDQWINRGVGVWALAATIWIVFEFASTHGLLIVGAK